MWHSQQDPNWSATEVNPQSFLWIQMVLAQSWGYSGSGKQGERGKAILASHSEKKVRIRVYKNQGQFKKPKIIISGVKLFTNTVVVQEIMSSKCRAQALKLFSASHFWWVDPLPPSYHPMYQYNVQEFKKNVKKPHKQKTPHDLPNTETEWKKKHEKEKNSHKH